MPLFTATLAHEMPEAGPFSSPEAETQAIRGEIGREPHQVLSVLPAAPGEAQTRDTSDVVITRHGRARTDLMIRGATPNPGGRFKVTFPAGSADEAAAIAPFAAASLREAADYGRQLRDSGARAGTGDRMDRIAVTPGTQGRDPRFILQMGDGVADFEPLGTTPDGATLYQVGPPQALLDHVATLVLECDEEILPIRAGMGGTVAIEVTLRTAEIGGQTDLAEATREALTRAYGACMPHPVAYNLTATATLGPPPASASARAAGRRMRLTSNLGLLTEAGAIMAHFGAGGAFDAMRDAIMAEIAAKGTD